MHIIPISQNKTNINTSKTPTRWFFPFYLEQVQVCIGAGCCPGVLMCGPTEWSQLLRVVHHMLRKLQIITANTGFSHFCH